MRSNHWVAWAMLRTQQVRFLLKAKCGEYHQWPIFVKDYDYFLPIDRLLNLKAANDNKAKS